MIERDQFLRALAEDEDDTATRLVYSDWLEEHGEHEEADRQRKWPAAKQWLVVFCRDHNSSYEQVITYEDLLELGRAAVEQAHEEWFGFDCGNNETMCDALRTRSREFWQNWSVITGIALPAGSEMKYHFSCGC
jgi:uncharacterized protein (TIGR02996 family)